MRCGYCGTARGAHDNCEQAFENGATWDHYDEGYLIPEPHRTEMLELAEIREAAKAHQAGPHNTERNHPMAKAESYPNIIRALIGGEPVELAAKITEDELPTRAPRTVIEFSPDNPPMRNGDSFTITTITETTADSESMQR